MPERLPSPKKFVVACDFDGFLTDPKTGAKSFYEAYIKAFAKSLKIDPHVARFFLNQGLSQVYNEPGKHGWEINPDAEWNKSNQKFIVSPAEADPYQLTKAAAQVALRFMDEDTQGKYNHKKREAIERIYQNDQSRPPKKRRYNGKKPTINSLLSEVFSEAYPQSEFEFRKGAYEFIERFFGKDKDKDIELVFVTNSGTESVKRKLQQLLQEHNSEIDIESIRIKGDAKKEDLGSDNSISIPGIEERSIYVDRTTYAKILKDIKADVVTGDNAEMDISIIFSKAIAMLGLRAIFMDTSKDKVVLTDEINPPAENKTIAAERAYLEKSKKVTVVEASESNALGLAAEAIASLAVRKTWKLEKKVDIQAGSYELKSRILSNGEIERKIIFIDKKGKVVTIPSWQQHALERTIFLTRQPV